VRSKCTQYFVRVIRTDLDTGDMLFADIPPRADFGPFFLWKTQAADAVDLSCA
jgi:tRNA(Ile2) C34 agmatinyltransferase TiaS